MPQSIHYSQSHVDWQRTLGQPWHSLILAIVGVVFSLVALQDWSEAAGRMAASVEVEGIVIDYAQRDGKRYPVVQYYDAAGQLYTVQAAMAVTAEQMQDFATMAVIYPEASAANGEVTSYWDVWMSTLRNALLAIVFLAGALFLWSRRGDIYSLDGAKH